MRQKSLSVPTLFIPAHNRFPILQYLANNIKRCLLKPIHYARPTCRSNSAALISSSASHLDVRSGVGVFHSIYNVIFWQSVWRKTERVWFRFICQLRSCVNSKNIDVKRKKRFLVPMMVTRFVEGQNYWLTALLQKKLWPVWVSKLAAVCRTLDRKQGLFHIQ